VVEALAPIVAADVVGTLKSAATPETYPSAL